MGDWSGGHRRQSNVAVTTMARGREVTLQADSTPAQMDYREGGRGYLLFISKILPLAGFLLGKLGRQLREKLH